MSMFGSGVVLPVAMVLGGLAVGAVAL